MQGSTQKNKKARAAWPGYRRGRVGLQAEDARPSLLQPQVMPTAKPVSIEPRLKAQALPEKDDHRFFDRWMLDWARELGERAVKIEALQKLADAGRAFAKWRSLRHAVVAERENAEDIQTVASTDSKVKKAEDEVTRCEARAVAEDRRAADYDREAKAATKARTALPPALRGSKTDVALVLLGNVVVFAVDLVVLHLALGLTTGSNREHWITAATMGAGAVLIGDVLGWLAAVGTIRADGTFRRPSWHFMVLVAVLSAAALWFFANLGTFRAESLQELARRDGLHIANPGFFTIGQALFFAGSALLCFSYSARRNGRELLRHQEERQTQRDVHRAKAEAFRHKAEQARQLADDAPIRRDVAIARVHSRAQIAEAEAKLDLQQGEYLAELGEPEYLKHRADVEVGTRYWRIVEESRTALSQAVKKSDPARAALAALLTAAAVFIVAGSLVAASLSGFVVAVALIRGARGHGSSETGEQIVKRDLARAFRAEIAASSTEGGRASDIDRLVPLASNGHDESITPDDLQKAVSDE